MFDGFSSGYVLVSFTIWSALALGAAGLLKARPWKSRSARIRAASRCFAASWTTVFLLAAMENGFAFFYDTTDSFAIAKSSKRWTIRYVTVNNWRFRDSKPFQLKRQPGVQRIALLGDSFTYGHGIADLDDRFGDLLESKLASACPGRFEIYNLAQPAADTRFHCNQLEKLNRDGFEADVVLYCYCLNDLDTITPGNDATIDALHRGRPDHFLLRELYLPNFLYFRLTVFRRAEFRNYYGWLADGYRGSTWKRQQSRLDELQQQIKEMRARLLVVVFPFLHQLTNEYEFEPAHRTLRDYWESRGVRFVDLLATMRAHAADGLVVNRFDAHPNERAHALAADVVWNDLLGQELSDARCAVEPVP